MYYCVHDEEQWKPSCNGTQLQTAVQYFGQDTGFLKGMLKPYKISLKWVSLQMYPEPRSQVSLIFQMGLGTKLDVLTPR